MNARVYVGGSELTDRCILDQTRINYDSNRNLTTAAVTLLGPKWGSGALAAYDAAYYDVDSYAELIEELAIVQILDGRDNATKLFEGQIYSIDLKQTDAAGSSAVEYILTLNDYAAWLDRAVAWGFGGVTFPTSDQSIIQSLVSLYAPKIDTSNVQMIAPNITGYDFQGKTLRQVLDDMIGLSAGQWRMDFDKKLYYNAVPDAPAAPFDLSTSPDNATSFPVRVDEYKRDFSNPVNHCYVMGAHDPSSAMVIQADYSDPVSIQKYGEYAFGLYNSQVTTIADAVLRATAEVMQYAYPLETGTFTIWKDGLELGQQVNLHEDWLGIDGAYIIKSLALAWKDQNLVEYKVTFGAARPSLERYLRLIDQLSRWSSMKPAVANPAPGSVTDGSIAPPGLTAGSIYSVNAQTLIGWIQAQQIQSVNAGAIIGEINAAGNATVNANVIQGVITADHIGGVDAKNISGVIEAKQIDTITADQITGSLSADHIGGVYSNKISGAITAGQIGSVNASIIQGVVISSQLADGIIDNLSKYATALQPIPIIKSTDPFPPALPSKNFPPNSYFYSAQYNHFYLINAAGTGYTDAGTDPKLLTGSMTFYNIGAINAESIIGLILAGQIQSIQATQITGSIQAGQIQSINVNQLTGTLTSTGGVARIDATAITGTIAAGQIGTITAGQITGKIVSTQIGSVSASTILGTIDAGNGTTVNANTIQGVITSSGPCTIQAGAITGTIQGSQIQNIQANTITIGVLADNQIGNIQASKLMVGTASAYTLTVQNSANQPIGYIGNLDGTNYGGWFKVFGAGGTGYANAPIYSDVNGNLFIRNTTLTITGSGGTMTASPTTYDPSYSTLALENVSGSDAAYFISRGLVVYYNSGKIGSLNRSPSGGYAELVLGAGGGLFYAEGNAGACRANGGYYVGGGVACINTSGQWVGADILSTGNVKTGGVFVTAGGNPGITYSIVVGSTTLYFQGGILYSHAP